MFFKNFVFGIIDWTHETYTNIWFSCQSNSNSGTKKRRQNAKKRSMFKIVIKYNLNIEKKNVCQRHAAFPGGHPSKY